MGVAGYDAVLLDAFGTLIDVDDPHERLREAVAGRLGVEVDIQRAQRAFTAEAAFYAAHCHEGRDASSLADLRAACARVVLEELRIDYDPDSAAALLMDSLAFRAYPDVAPTLRGLAEAGVRVAVVSNADCSLPLMLADAGLVLEHVFSSAAVGASKPDPAIFRQALSALGVEPGRALHVGDTPAADGAGARAAGVDVLIVDRDGPGDPGTITSLTEILELIT
jgi:putative hydrolase of the HAD superfamily